MGLYINPKEGTKESWLKLKGEGPLHSVPKLYKEGTKFVVWLVSNGLFNAAGVMWRQEELEEFSNINDIRPKLWFLVEESDIREVCGEGANFYLGVH